MNQQIKIHEKSPKLLSLRKRYYETLRSSVKNSPMSTASVMVSIDFNVFNESAKLSIIKTASTSGVHRVFPVAFASSKGKK